MQEEEMKVNGKEIHDNCEENIQEEMRIMKEMMGFSMFSSTHNKRVFGNKEKNNIAKQKKVLEKTQPKARQYTQYLHKKGIYDIPLTRQQLEENNQKETERKISKMEL